MADFSGIKAVLVRLRPKYPTPLGKASAYLLREAALEFGRGAGLYKKTSGNNAHGFSMDILVFPDAGKFRTFDVLIDAENKGTPTFRATEPTGVIDNPSKYVPAGNVVLPEPGPVPPDPPPPPPPDPPDPPDPPPSSPPSDVENRLALLEGLSADLEDRIMTLEAKKLPPYKGSLFGTFTITSHPVEE
jgi:hypothetical protein